MIYGTQIINQKFDLLSSLFGVPFLIGSIILISITVIAILGKVQVQLTSNGGTIFTGVGKIGRTKKFTWNEISKISEVRSFVSYNKGSSLSLAFQGQRQITFGSGLSSEKRFFFLNAIRKTLETKRWTR